MSLGTTQVISNPVFVISNPVFAKKIEQRVKDEVTKKGGDGIQVTAEGKIEVTKDGNFVGAFDNLQAGDIEKITAARTGAASASASDEGSVMIAAVSKEERVAGAVNEALAQFINQLNLSTSEGLSTFGGGLIQKPFQSYGQNKQKNSYF